MGEKTPSAVWNGACGESGGHKCTLAAVSDPRLRLSDTDTPPRCRRATPERYWRLPVVHFNFHADGRQIVEASEWSSRVAGKKHAAAQSLIIKSVYKKFPSRRKLVTSAMSEESMTCNEFTSRPLRRSPQEFLPTSSLCCFCMLYTCILRFNTIIPSQRHLGETTALMDAVVSDRLASMISNVKTGWFHSNCSQKLLFYIFSSLQEVTETLSPV